MNTSELLNLAEEIIDKAVRHFKNELAGLQVGRASAGLVENLQVDIYGAAQILKNIANISVPEAKTLFIESWAYKAALNLAN